MAGDITRRQFIKIGAGGAGAVAAGAALTTDIYGLAPPRPAADPGTEGDRVVPPSARSVSGSAGSWPMSRMAG